MLVVSLKYSPVYVSHIQAIYAGCQELSREIKILCHSTYYLELVERGIPESNIFIYKPKSRGLLGEFFSRTWRNPLISLGTTQHFPCLVLNPHPWNFLFFIDYKKYIKGKCYLWLHEPYKTLSELVEFGFFKGCYYFLALQAAKLSIGYIDHCFLPSQFALKRFKFYFPPQASRCSLLPLSFPAPSLLKKQKKYFTFVGHVNKGKGIAVFLDLVNFCQKNYLNYQFKLISSSLTEPWLSYAKELKNLSLITKPFVSDLEISSVICESFAVMCLYTTVTQSSVVATAFGHGVPVIASMAGSLPESVCEGKTGYFIRDLSDFPLMIERMDQCIENCDLYYEHCLNEFKDRYSIQALRPYLLEIFNL